MSSSLQHLYRARDGAIFGVCLGLARYRDIPVHYIRFGLVILALCTGFWPCVAVYILAAVLIKLEPSLPTDNQAEENFYVTYSNSRREALQELQEHLYNLDKRIRKMEDVVTRSDFDWESRLRR